MFGFFAICQCVVGRQKTVRETAASSLALRLLAEGLQDFNRTYFARPQLAAELPNQLGSSLSKLFKLHFKPSNEAASAAFGRKLPVLFAADVELDERSAHLYSQSQRFVASTGRERNQHLAWAAAGCLIAPLWQ
jgi:hypothetical protein